MEFEKKLQVLGDGARYDLSCACGEGTHRTRGPLDRWLYPSVLPDGRTAWLFKVLLTNACDKRCGYCENGAGRDFPRVSFEPAELARAFVDLNRAGLAEGIFLSSAVRGGAVATMDRMLAAAEELRGRHAFRGYLHLKILPGAEEAQVERAGRLATRVSLNLEVPAGRYLERIAPCKRAGDLMRPLEQMKRSSLAGGRRWSPSGYTTQFMVGAAGETDRELVGSTFRLYREMGARRVYFSAFQPVAGTPLEGRPSCPTVREHRLYQCDFLLRKYGFHLDEIPFDAGGGLSADEDPKSGWARAHPELFPVEVNAAPPELLVRVPGIGPKSAARIVAARRTGSIGSPEELARIAPAARTAGRFLLFNGRSAPRQLDLVEERARAG